MKYSTYTLSQRYVAYILLVSFFLQSCGNFPNPLVPGEFIAKESINNIQKPTKPIDTKSLVDQALNAEGGYLVTFHEEKGDLVADVRVDKTQKEPNYRSLPIEMEKGTDLAALLDCNKERQQRHIQLGRAQDTKPSRILVFKRGLTGGMKKESDESDSEEVEKEDDNLLEDEDPNDELSSLLEAKLGSNKENIEKDSKNEIIKPEKGPIPGSVIKLPTSTQPKAVSGIKSGLTGEIKSRKGFTPEISSAVEKALSSILSLGYKIGTAYDNGDCFFDTLTQLLNTNNNNALANIKYLRGLCYSYYCKNKDIVNTWIQQDNLISPNLKYDYENIKNSAKEVEVPIWGKPVVEGRILCNHGILTHILVIEVLKDPYTDNFTAGFYVVDKDGYKSTSQQEVHNLLQGNQVTAVVNVQGELHFVPLLKVSGASQEEQKNKENSKESQPKAKKKQAKREAQKGGKDAQHQQNIDNEKELQNARRLQEDLKNLRQIESLITSLISSSDSGSKIDEELVLNNLKQIGQLIHDITWKEDNPACIRNRHGYRNRYVKASNARNDKGARLDFETLGHLKDLADDSDFNKLLTVNPSILISSLKVLKAKVDYILANAEPQKPLEGSEKQEVGFLNTVSAFYHDKVCLDRLIKLTSEINSEGFKQFDLNNKLHRYHLGYYFCLIGETAKQISDYIKPEWYQDATLNLTRFLFGKLGYYRQAIKKNPGLVYRDQHTELLQMKLLLEKANSIGLSSFLQFIKSQMIESLIKRANDTGEIDHEKTVTVIDTTYPSINQLAKTTSNSCASKFSKFEQGYLTQIKDLTVTLDNGTEEDLNKKIQRSETYKQGLIVKISELEKELKQLSAPETKELPTQQLTADHTSEHVSRLVNQVLNASIAREIKSLIDSLSADIRQQLSKKLTPIQLNTIQLIDQFAKPAEQAKKPDAKTDLVMVISQKLKKYEKDLDKAIEQFRKKGEGAAQSSNKEYIEIKSLMERNKANKPTLLQELFASLSKIEPSKIKKDKATLERQIEAAKLEIEEVEYNIGLTKMHVKEILLSIPSTKKEAIPEGTSKNSVSAKKPSTTYRTLRRINHEIKFLRELEVSTDPKINYASMMSMGFIGQYCKEIFTDTNPIISAELKQHTNNLVEECIAKTIHIRHKLIMHNSTEGGHEEIKKVSTEFLVPSIKDFEALITVTNFDEGSQDLIELSTAFARLGKYDKALEIIKKCHKSISRGERLIETNYDKLNPVTEEDKYALELWRLISKICPPEVFSEVSKKAYEGLDTMVLLSHELDVQISKQDFSGSLQTADKLIDIADKTRKLISQNLIPQLAGRLYIDSRYLYGKIQKAASLDRLDKKREAHNILNLLKIETDKGEFDTEQHANAFIRMYGDLILYEPEKSEEYLAKMESLLKYCEDKPMALFNYLNRKFDYVISNKLDGNEAERICKDLNGLLDSNKSQLRNRYGDLVYNFEMKLRLHELNIVYCDGDIIKEGLKDIVKGNNLVMQKIDNIFQRMDDLFPKVQDKSLRDSYLEKKSIEESRKKKLKETQALIERKIIEAFKKSKVRRAWSEIQLSIPTQNIESGDLKYYCQSQLEINSKALEFDNEEKTCLIPLNEKAMDILRNKVRSYK